MQQSFAPPPCMRSFNNIPITPTFPSPASAQGLATLYYEPHLSFHHTGCPSLPSSVFLISRPTHNSQPQDRQRSQVGSQENSRCTQRCPLQPDLVYGSECSRGGLAGAWRIVAGGWRTAQHAGWLLQVANRWGFGCLSCVALALAGECDEYLTQRTWQLSLGSGNGLEFCLWGQPAGLHFCAGLAARQVHSHTCWQTSRHAGVPDHLPSHRAQLGSLHERHSPPSTRPRPSLQDVQVPGGALSTSPSACVHS